MNAKGVAKVRALFTSVTLTFLPNLDLGLVLDTCFGLLS